MNDPVKCYPPGYPYSWKDVPPQACWVENMIPAGGSVLLFGPAGVGKTVFICNMLNAIALKQQFLGRNTNYCVGMFLSLDTPQNDLKRRWLTSNPKFAPQFAFAPYLPFDCLHPDFEKSILYGQMQDRQKLHKAEIIVVDSLRDTFNGEMNNDNIPKEVYGAFQKWFGGSTVVFIHHTRKQQVVNGKLVSTGIDDEATGSKYWINKAQVSLYLKKINDNGVLSLQMGKSQCFQEWDEPIRINMDNMEMSEWTKSKANQLSLTYSTALTHVQGTDPLWATYTEAEKDTAIATHLGVSPRTVRKSKAAFRKMIP